jgi:hypothetical protein
VLTLQLSSPRLPSGPCVTLGRLPLPSLSHTPEEVLQIQLSEFLRELTCLPTVRQALRMVSQRLVVFMALLALPGLQGFHVAVVSPLLAKAGPVQSGDLKGSCIACPCLGSDQPNARARRNDVVMDGWGWSHVRAGVKKAGATAFMGGSRVARELKGQCDS